jgi:Uma2 family endonuclease
VIEILSPDDPFARVLRKCWLYEKWGIRQIIVIDPKARLEWSFENGSLRGTDIIARRGGSVIKAQELWAEVDRRHSRPA